MPALRRSGLASPMRRRVCFARRCQCWRLTRMRAQPNPGIGTENLELLSSQPHLDLAAERVLHVRAETAKGAVLARRDAEFAELHRRFHHHFVALLLVADRGHT